MLPRVAKAAIKALIYIIVIYVIPALIIGQASQFAPDLFANYTPVLGLFVGVIVFFVVASELTSGTIISYAFSVGRAIVLLVFFVLALNGGIIESDVMGLSLWVDIRIFLMMLVTIDLLSLAKSVLQAVNFMQESAEGQLPQPRPC